MSWFRVLKKIPFRPRGRVHVASLVGSIFLVLVAYQNCGSDFVASDSSSLSSVSAAECNSFLQTSFQQSFYPFLSTTCNACHVPGGIGKGAFASSDISDAYNAFVLDTPSEVEARAVDPSHASGITGPANQTSISNAEATWNSAVAMCNTTTTTPVTYVTSDQLISGSTTVKTFTWNLDTDLANGPGNYGGATFTIGVQEVTNASGDTLYYFTAPTVITGTVALNIGDITIRLNGVDQTLMTTYTQLNFRVPASTTQVMCTTTGTDPFTFAASDTIGVKFGILNTNPSSN